MISEIPKLKLPEYFIENKHSFLMFVGKSKSGKSSLLTALLTHCKIYKKKFESILYFHLYPNAQFYKYG